EDSTRTMVNGSAYQTSRCSVVAGPDSGPVAGPAARLAKYTANRAAQNISSLESQTMVPTLTILGLVREWIWLFGRASAVTRSLLPLISPARDRGADTA